MRTCRKQRPRPQGAFPEVVGCYRPNTRPPPLTRVVPCGTQIWRQTPTTRLRGLWSTIYSDKEPSDREGGSRLPIGIPCPIEAPSFLHQRLSMLSPLAPANLPTSVATGHFTADRSKSHRPQLQPAYPLRGDMLAAMVRPADELILVEEQHRDQREHAGRITVVAERDRRGMMALGIQPPTELRQCDDEDKPDAPDEPTNTAPAAIANMRKKPNTPATYAAANSPRNQPDARASVHLRPCPPPLARSPPPRFRSRPNESERDGVRSCSWSRSMASPCTICSRSAPRPPP